MSAYPAERRRGISAITAATWVIAAVVLAVAFYLCWLAVASPRAFIQMSFNGIVIGSVYAIAAIGFSLIYSTVRFFDISFGAMPLIAAYTVVYLTQDANSMLVNAVAGTFLGLMAAYALYIWAYQPMCKHLSTRDTILTIAAISLAAAAYVALLMGRPNQLNTLLAPIVGCTISAAIVWACVGVRHKVVVRVRKAWVFWSLSGAIAGVLGVYSAVLIHNASGANLYLAWLLGVVLAGATGMLLYGAIYKRLRVTGRSALVPMIAAMGILLTIVAIVSIVFSPNPQSLPPPFGTVPWKVAGATLKPFNVFVVGALLALFVLLIWMLKRTTLGKQIRATGDEEELALAAGINTPAIIMLVYLIAGAYGGLAGVFLAEDTALRPATGLELLFKGWVASVVGGLGNISGALMGGLLLGLMENYAVWYIPTQWKDPLAFLLLVLFLLFRPQGLFPRR